MIPTPEVVYLKPLCVKSRVVIENEGGGYDKDKYQKELITSRSPMSFET